MKVLYTTVLCTVMLIRSVFAGEADVLNVEAEPAGPGLFQFSVTVRHDDKGWDHYANKWDVVAPDGAVLATRILHHPHENEQPFTRNMGGIAIPKSISAVTVRAHDSVHGYGGKIITIQLPR